MEWEGVIWSDGVERRETLGLGWSGVPGGVARERGSFGKWNEGMRFMRGCPANGLRRLDPDAFGVSVGSVRSVAWRVMGDAGNGA